MKTKLFGIALILIGVLTLGWIGVVVLLTKGMTVLLYGIIPLVAGWLIFNSAVKQESQETKPEKETVEQEIKTGVSRLRSFVKSHL